MEKSNYLGNLPKRKKGIKNLLSEKHITYLLNGLTNCYYGTDNQKLKDFKDDFISIMINKINYGYDINNYYDIRNVFTQFPEYLIIHLCDELIDLLNKKDNENINTMEELTKIYDFTFLSERVKNDNRYVSKTRDITISDIYQAVIVLDKKIESFITLYIKNIMSSEMNIDELKIFREMLNESDLSSCYVKYNKEFGMFKDCGVPIFEKLYNLHYKELHHKLITKVDREINKLGLVEQKNKVIDYDSYLYECKTKNYMTKKRKTWKRF